MTRKNIFLLFLVLVLAGVIFAWKPIKAIYLTRVPSSIENPFVCIPSGADYETVLAILKKQNIVEDEAAFTWLAEKMNYKKEKMRTGRFEVKPGWSNRDLITHLRAGEQAPVKIVLNNERLMEEIAGKIARSIETDSLTLLQTFQNPAFLSEIGYKTETLITAFIPNTYEVFWNIEPKALVKRMLKEHDAFWDKNDRRAKAKALGMTPEEVYTLASIVERETNYVPEKPAIAGVYLNRLKIGMKLQADPTSVFATRDFATHRVTQFHTGFDSPYNTYMYAGLPPGPISMASIPSLDAVLNRDNHDYLYFCAKDDESGTHAFAATLAAHNVNAAKFRAWMASKGIH